MRGFLLTVSCWLALAGACPAEKLPPKPANYFNDYAGVVSAPTARRLNEELRKFEQDTTLACPEVQYLVDFIRNSQRGPLLRRPTRRTEEAVADE